MTVTHNFLTKLYSLSCAFIDLTPYPLPFYYLEKIP